MVDIKSSKPKVLVAGYTRVSTASQADESKVSLQEQKESIENFAKAHGWQISNIYEDAGVSGARDIRPGLSCMKDDAKQGLFQKLIFAKIDRFGRSIRQIQNNWEYFEGLGIDIISIKESVDTSTAMGRMVRNVLATLAEFELEIIRERTVMGLSGRAKKGFPIGKTTFGYRWDGKEKAYFVEPDESNIYKTIIDLFLNRNKSLLFIAKTLNEKGYRTRYKKKWTQTSLSKVLRNPFYLGRHKYTCQGTEYELPTPPMIDKRRWELIQDRIKENVRKPKNFDPNSPFILRGLLKCGECGYGLTAMVMGHDKEGKPYRFYKCYVANLRPSMRAAKNLKPGKEKCALPTLNAVEIENYVLGSIFGFFMFPQNLIDLWKERVNVGEAGKLESELRSHRTKLGALESRRERLLDLYLDGEIDKKHLKEREQTLKQTIDRMREDIVDLEGRLSEMGSMQERLNELKEMTQEIKKLSPAFKEAVGKMTNKQLREFIEATLAGQKVTVSIMRKWDVSENDRGLSAKVLNEPVYKFHAGRKLAEWKVDEGTFDLVSAADYVRPLVWEYISRAAP